MSFILDALRKSEHERRRSTVPGLSHVPLAAPRRTVPGWALAVMGILAGAVLVLGGAWWQSQRSVPAQAPTPPPVAVSPTVLAPPSAPPTAAAPPATTSPPVAASAAPNGAPTPPPAASQPSASLAAPEAAGEQKGESLASAVAAGLARPRTTASGPTLPSAAALNAQGIGVPTLHLELHAYSDSPGERFVFINGHRYREGERLAEGPEVISIEPDGVVLSQQGQRFMLAPE